MASNPNDLKRSREPDDELKLLEELYENLSHGITMKGALVSYALLHGGKNIENRKKKISPGWVAVHTGSGKIDNEIEDYVKKNLKARNLQCPEEKDLPHSVIVGAIHIKSSYNYNKKNIVNSWELGPVCNVIDKAVAFDEEIHCKGAISLKWPFDSIDKRERKIGKFDGTPLREKVKKVISKQIEKLRDSLKKK